MPQQASTQAPQTREQLDALREQRNELTSQLQSLGNRRAELMAQEHIGSDAEARVIQEQIRQLEGRSAQLETRIASLNDQIATAVGRGVGTRGADVGPGSPVIAGRQLPQIPQIPQIVIPPMGPMGPMQTRLGMRDLTGALALEAVTFLLLGLVFWQFGWKRMRAQLAQALGDQSARVQQLQQSLDVIGIEVERISEGQRYVAKMLSGGDAGAIASAAEKVPVRRNDR
jgi:hypothetical protein